MVMECGSFRRLFTVAEANQLLPLIRPKVSRVRDALISLKAEIAAAAREGQVAPWDPRVAQRLDERGVAVRLAEEVGELTEEIQAHGCLVNGPEEGLVDFPCLLGSEIVFLCWKLGEEQVCHWHRVSEGFPGRRPLLDRRVGIESVN
jgi:hypothetical protein